MSDSDDTETDRLVAEMDALPDYRGWRFSYMYPGYFSYSHPDNDYLVLFTPDWEGDETLPIQVQVKSGRDCGDLGDQLSLPREGRTGQKIFEMVRSTLDKVLAVSVTIELVVQLTATEIEALQVARDHVREYMAIDHSWAVRDAAVTAIGKLLSAAQPKENP